MIKALIFDFDGTILDTETPDFESWRTIYREHGHELDPDAWSECIGTDYSAFNPFDHLENLVGRPVDRTGIARRHREHVSGLIASCRPLPGICELIDEARAGGLKLGVASSSPASWVRDHLQRFALWKKFDAVRTADDVKRVKPDPELYLSVIEALGCRGAEAVAIEDSSHGAAAARAAGLFCVVVPNDATRCCKFPHAHRIFSSAAEIQLDKLHNY